MPILHLTLKRRWFDMIASGRKLEEYREIKPHWQRIFQDGRVKIAGKFCDPGEGLLICFSHGYRKDRPQVFVECRGVVIRTGRPEWGAEAGREYFVLQLGGRIRDSRQSLSLPQISNQPVHIQPTGGGLK